MRLSLILICAFALAACGSSSSSDKAGGTPARQRTRLTLAYGTGIPDQVDAFRHAVDNASGGALDIAFKEEWRHGQSDYEAATIRDVAAGKLQMAAVGARAFDRVGVTSFQPLLSPLLVDSYSLEQQVFKAGIPQQMLKGVERAGVVGVAVLPGPMRKLLGVSRAFRTPADFRDQTVGYQDSALTETTLKALGAQPLAVPSEADISAMDGYEQQLSSIANNDYDRRAASITANLNLWPRPLVVVMNRKAYDKLTSAQRRALTAAGQAAIDPAIAASRAEDTSARDALCSRGIALARADLGALRQAVGSVEPQGPAATEIAQIKTRLAAQPESPKCSRASREAAADTAGAGKRSAIDGTYEFTTTAEDLRAVAPRDVVLENYGHFRWTLRNGQFRTDQSNGPSQVWTTGKFSVRGHLVTFTIGDTGGQAPHGFGPDSWAAKPGDKFTYRWDRYRDQLTLRAVKGAISPEPNDLKPWRRVR